MRLRQNLGLLYGILVFLILAIGAWWAFYMVQEGRHYEQYRLQLFATERLHAAFLINSVPEIAADPEGQLGEDFPELEFVREGERITVRTRPEAIAAVHREAARRRRMFLSEGAFFLVLLMAGTTILTVAARREQEFKRARELFLAGATHEFKTPLASLRLYTETLSRPDLETAQRQRILDAMIQDIERLEGMVEQVLAVSRDADGTGPLRPEPLDVAEEVRAVLDQLAPLFQSHGARIETTLPPGCRVLGDRQLLRTAVRNLVHNAVMYSPAPATVRVVLQRRDGRCRLTVSDDGPGIPRREQRRIFDSFTRGSSGVSRSGGSGLGLYLVKRNTERLGGRIELASSPGHGAAFTLDLPATTDRPAGATAGEGAS